MHNLNRFKEVSQCSMVLRISELKAVYFAVGKFQAVLCNQNVFAYLPLRSYGFRFIIQGDFEVPSSREDVDIDKPWNQWLREEIPQLFLEALDVFRVRCYQDVVVVDRNGDFLVFVIFLILFIFLLLLLLLAFPSLPLPLHLIFFLISIIVLIFVLFVFGCVFVFMFLFCCYCISLVNLLMLKKASKLFI